MGRQLLKQIYVTREGNGTSYYVKFITTRCQVAFYQSKVYTVHACIELQEIAEKRDRFRGDNVTQTRTA